MVLPNFFSHATVLLLHLYSYHPASCCPYASCIPQACAKQTEGAAYSEGDYFYNNSAVSKASTHNIKPRRIRFISFPIPSEMNSKLP